MEHDCHTNTQSSNDGVSSWLDVAFGALHRLIKSKWCFGTLLLALLVLQLLCLDPYLDTGGDNALYIVLARSLAKGNGYRLANTPDNVPFVKAPPVFPLSLAPFTLLGGNDLRLLKLSSAASFWLALLPLYYLVRPALGVPGARVLVLLSITNPWLYRYANTVRPEGLYLLFSLTALVLFACSKDRSTGSLVPLSLAALCAALAFLARSIGVSLMIALLAVLAWRRHWRDALVTMAVYAVVLAPWLLHLWGLPADARQNNYLQELMAPGENSHGLPVIITQTAHLGRLTLENLPTYPESWAGALLYAPTRFFNLASRHIPAFALMDNLLGLAVLAMLFWGIWLSLRRRVDPLAAYVVGYMVICLVWPWQGEKFLVPLIPLALFFLSGSVRVAEALLTRSGRRNLPLMPTLAVLLLVINLGGDTALHLRRVTNPYPPEWQSYFAVADWTATHLSQDAVVMARKPYLFHLRSGHLTVPYAPVEDDADILTYLRSCGADYPVVGAVRPEQEDSMAGVVSRHREMFAIEYATGPPTTELYRFLP